MKVYKSPKGGCLLEDTLAELEPDRKVYTLYTVTTQMKVMTIFTGMHKETKITKISIREQLIPLRRLVFLFPTDGNKRMEQT